MELSKFKELIKKGVSIVEYLLLSYINSNLDIKEIVTTTKYMGIVQAMITKSYIVNISGKLRLTDIGKKLLNLTQNTIEIKEEDVIVLEESKDVYDNLLVNLQEALNKKIQKKQIKGFGGVYFIPTDVELKDHLKRFWKKYPKFKDINKIQEVLIEHINKCCLRGSFAPAIKYFIMKQDSGGMLASAYTAEREDKKELIKAINTKDLF